MLPPLRCASADLPEVGTASSARRRAQQRRDRPANSLSRSAPCENTWRTSSLGSASPTAPPPSPRPFPPRHTEPGPHRDKQPASSPVRRRGLAPLCSDRAEGSLGERAPRCLLSAKDQEASVTVCSSWIAGPRRGGDSLPIVVTPGPASADDACNVQARDSQPTPGLGGSARRNRPGARRPSAMTRGNPSGKAPASRDAARACGCRG